MLTFPLKNELETRILIAEKGKSLRTFSKKINISHSYLSQILTGKKRPSPTVAYKIAKGLDLKIEDLFFTKSG